MPPWKADPSNGPFVDQHPLSDAEIAMLGRWVEQGSPEGDPRELPAPRTWTEGWQLGKPDLVITLPDAYTLPAEGTDVFRIFTLPIPTATARFVRGLEFRPGNPKVVHHANIRIDPTAGSRRLDDQDPAPGYDGLIARSAIYPDGHFLGLDAGAGRAAAAARSRVAPRSQHRSRRRAAHAAERQAGARRAVDRPLLRRPGSDADAVDAAARTAEYRHRPGDARYLVTDSYVLPVDVEVQAVQPHAHYRLRDARGEATLPDGTKRSLVAIKDWDFRWQHVYRFETPVRLPKGTTLSMRYAYDNSAANPRNPQQPPARARWGQRSSDEMGDLWVQVLTRDDDDLARLNRDFRPEGGCGRRAGIRSRDREAPGRSRPARRCGAAVPRTWARGESDRALRDVAEAEAGLSGRALQPRHRADRGAPA